MNRQQRRASQRRTHASAVPACYLLYCPVSHMYVADADAETRTLSLTEEPLAAALPTREIAEDLADTLYVATGLRFAIQPRYLSHYH